MENAISPRMKVSRLSASPGEHAVDTMFSITNCTIAPVGMSYGNLLTHRLSITNTDTTGILMKSQCFYKS